MAFLRRRRTAFGVPVVRETVHDDAALDELAHRLRDGDVDAAARGLAECRAYADLRMLRLSVLASTVAEGAADLTDLVERAEGEKDPELLLLAGAALIEKAQRDPEGFGDLLRRAADLLRLVTELLPEDATPWATLMPVLVGLRADAREHAANWREVLRRRPLLFAANMFRIRQLAPQWGGSEEHMMGFAQAVVRDAPPGNPVVAVLPAAHFECLIHRTGEPDEHSRRSYFRDVHGDVAHAADKWVHHASRHPASIGAHGTFAAAFIAAGDDERTRRHLHGMAGQMAPDFQWGLIGVRSGADLVRIAERVM